MQTLDEARVHMNRDIFAPVFFNKLAELGRAPQTQKQADTLLQIGVHLLGLEEQETVKRAASQEDDLGAALTDLHALTGAFYGPAVDPQVKQACLEYVDRHADNLTAALILDQAGAPAN